MKKFNIIVVIFATIIMVGCSTDNVNVVASSNSVLGFQLGQNPVSQAPETKFGYSRQELAVVPTNRGTDGEDGSKNGGAKDSTDALMELRYMGKGDGLYQRLAVGSTAVSQPGAAVMMLRDEDGKIAPEVAAAVLNIPAANPEASDAKAPVAAAYANATPAARSQFDSVAIANGWNSFADFIADAKVTPEQVEKVANALRKLGILK